MGAGEACSVHLAKSIGDRMMHPMLSLTAYTVVVYFLLHHSVIFERQC
jgi:hypothetical protein